MCDGITARESTVAQVESMLRCLWVTILVAFLQLHALNDFFLVFEDFKIC
jgi:hypothetical protein